MRILRHDNHLLWFGLLTVVVVSLYLLMSYVVAQRTKGLTTAAKRAMSDAHSVQTDAVLSAAEDESTETETSAPSDASPKRRVRFDLPAETVDSDRPQPVSTTPHTVFLDIAKQDFLKSPFVGRLVIRLYPEQAPRTAHNFAKLCADKKYVNIPFHRVVKDFMIQGGDIVNQDGTGTYSVYGGEGSTFEDEPFVLTHNRPGLLSMANSGPNTNGSQFFILTNPAPHLDGKHVVFGEVIQGMEFVRDIESEVTDPNDRPVRKCYVLNCGVVETEGTGDAASTTQAPVTDSSQATPAFAAPVFDQSSPLQHMHGQPNGTDPTQQHTPHAQHSAPMHGNMHGNTHGNTHGNAQEPAPFAF